MYYLVRITFFLTIFISIASCGSFKKINNKKVSALGKTRSTKTINKISSGNGIKKISKTQRANDYIKKYSSTAKEEMKKFKIPASITLAQGMLESGFGYGTLARKGNNHFGIKCHKGWKGRKIYHDDDKKGECFRVYKNAKKSYRDHSIFLSQRGRYSFLFDYKITNYKAWAKGLKKAGYATDPNYSKKLIDLIERYDLYRFDKRRFLKNKKIQFVEYHKVKKGDTLYSISKKYGITVKDLIKENKLKNNTIYLGQELKIY